MREHWLSGHRKGQEVAVQMLREAYTESEEEAEPEDATCSAAHPLL